MPLASASSRSQQSPHAYTQTAQLSPSVTVDAEESDDDSDDDSEDDSQYMSFSESENEDQPASEEEVKAERDARAIERQRVLEAAGLVVKTDKQPPPRPVRKPSVRRRRPPPAAPNRLSVVSTASDKDLPAVPESPSDPSIRLDDAFARYEEFKKTKGFEQNRLSVSSFDTTPSSPTGAPSLAPSVSRESATGSDHGRRSHFLHFLGRNKTPNEGERKTISISAPISGPFPGPPSSRSSTPALQDSSSFGSVS
jgi:actin cytoskeleton-regulatory complex protein PAN1